MRSDQSPDQTLHPWSSLWKSPFPALVWHDLTPKTALGYIMAVKAIRNPSVVFVWFCRHKDGKNRLFFLLLNHVAATSLSACTAYVNLVYFMCTW